MIRSLKYYLSTQKQEHNTIDHLEERGVRRKKKIGDQSLKDETGLSAVRQISELSPRPSFGNELLRDEIERIWVFPRASIQSRTELTLKSG